MTTHIPKTLGMIPLEINDENRNPRGMKFARGESFRTVATECSALTANTCSTNKTRKYEPPPLRICQPDLKIVVGEGEGQRTYLYHSQVMASHSIYIDTILSMPRNEGELYKIGLPDVPAKTWENMMVFLKPSMVRQLDYQRASQLARFYNKYQFTEGVAICDIVLSQELSKQANNKNSVNGFPYSLSFLIDTVLVAQRYNLSQTLGAGKEKLCDAFNSRDVRARMTEGYINRLRPVIARSDRLWGELNLKVGSAMDLFDRENIMDEQLFGHVVSTQLRMAELQLSVIDTIDQVEMRGAGIEFCNGIFTKDDSGKCPYDDTISFTKKVQIDGEETVLRLYGTGDCTWYVSALESDNSEVTSFEETRHFYRANPVYSGPFYYWAPPRVEWEAVEQGPAPTLYYGTYETSCLL